MAKRSGDDRGGAGDGPARPFRGTIRIDPDGTRHEVPYPPGGSPLQRAAARATRAPGSAPSNTTYVWTRGEEILFAVALATTIAAIGSFALLAASMGASWYGVVLAVGAGVLLGWLFLSGAARDMRRSWWHLWLVIPVTAAYTIGTAIALV